MARIKTLLLSSPPYPVENALHRLGTNLRRARLARNLTHAEVATKIGTGVRAIADAEKGRPGTAAAVYLALLWVYDLLAPVAQLADPSTDPVGLAATTRRERARTLIPPPRENDF
jgi:transcriptional regulator with XRE-family HTH domain